MKNEILKMQTDPSTLCNIPDCKICRHKESMWESGGKAEWSEAFKRSYTLQAPSLGYSIPE